MEQHVASAGDSAAARGAWFHRGRVKAFTVLALFASLGLYAATASAQAPAPKTPSATVTATAPKAPAGVSAQVTVPAPSAAVSATVAAPGAPVGAAAVAPAGTTTVAVAAPAAPGSPASTAAAAPAMDGATYAVRLRDLEANVDELKDRIRRSHTRLALLSDTILSGGAGGSRAEISLDNEMSSAFRLSKALVVLDGAVQYNRSDDTGALADQKSIPVFSGSVPPGDHTLQVVLTFQGNGYGVFSYLRSYHWDLKSSHSFTSVEGKTLTLTATALEKGGVTTPLDQRPSVEWKEKVQSLTPGADAPGVAATAGAPPKAAPASGTSK
jgi:hypothetical protein